MAINFPSTIRRPSYGLTPVWDRPVIESPFEDGSTQVRIKYTRGRDSYTIPWDYLTDAEVSTLENFYKNTTAYGVLPFTFTIPLNTGNKTISCRIVENPSVTIVSNNNWKVSIKVQEV